VYSEGKSETEAKRKGIGTENAVGADYVTVSRKRWQLLYA
jgi:hypothetical protein